MDWEEWLEERFNTDDLDTVVRRESMDDLAPEGASRVDIAVTVDDAWNMTSDTRLIGLAYYPSGLVVKGVQTIKEGETVVMRNVLVRRDQELIVAMDAERAVTLSVHGTGYTLPTQEPGGDSSDPLANFLKGLGQGMGGVLTVVAVGALAVYLAKTTIIPALAKSLAGVTK